MTRTLRIGTRGSQLALVQARWVAARLAEHDVPTELVTIRTEGDDRPVDTAWGEGAFVGRIVEALLDGSVDLAVHSAKDVPDGRGARGSSSPPTRPARTRATRSSAACAGRRSRRCPMGARVGTDSPRRGAFLRAVRPDLDIRAAPRQRRHAAGQAGPRRRRRPRARRGGPRAARARRPDRRDPARLDWSRRRRARASLAVQVRADDAEAIEAVAPLDDPATRTAVQAERALLNATGGGCRSPIGALGRAATATRSSSSPRPSGPGCPQPDAAVRADGRPDRMAPGPRARCRPPRAGGAAGAPGRDAPRAAAGARRSAPTAQAGAAARRARGGRRRCRERPRDRDRADAGRRRCSTIALSAGAGRASGSSSRARTAPTPVVAALGRLDLARRPVRLGRRRRGVAAVLAAAGADDAFVPTDPDATTLAAELPVTPGHRVLVAARRPRGSGAPGRRSARRGATVTRGRRLPHGRGPDGVRSPASPRRSTTARSTPSSLTSGSIARGLLALAADDEVRARLRATPVVAIGAPSRGRGTRRGVRHASRSPRRPTPSRSPPSSPRALGARDP